DPLAEPRVGIRLSEVGEITGEHEGGRPDTGRLDLGERALQVRLRRDAAVQWSAPGEEVRVAQVHDHLARWGVLAKLKRHAPSLTSTSDADQAKSISIGPRAK